MVSKKIPPTAATPQRKRRIKKMIFSVVMLIPFSAAMYFIFHRADQPEKTDVQMGDVPAAVEQKIAETKLEAVERQQQENIQTDRVKSLWENAFNLIEEKDESAEAKPKQPDNIERSRQTYREVSRQIGSFHKQPKADPEIEKLKKQIEEMTAQLERRNENRADPTDMMERSYQLAAKYLTPKVRDSAAAKPVQATKEQSKTV